MTTEASYGLGAEAPPALPGRPGRAPTCRPSCCPPPRPAPRGARPARPPPGRPAHRPARRGPRPRPPRHGSRARSRSPRLTAVSALTGQLPNGLAVAFAAVVLAYGWTRLFEAPTPGWGAAVVGAGGVARRADRGPHPDEPLLRWVPASLGVSLVRRLPPAAAAARARRSDAWAGGDRRRPVGRPAWACRSSSCRSSAGGAPTSSWDDRRRAGRPHRAARPGRVGPALAAAAGARRRRGRRAALTSAALDAATVLPAPRSACSWPVSRHIVRRVLAPLPGAAGLPARLAIGAASVLSVGVLVYLVTRLLVA